MPQVLPAGPYRFVALEDGGLAPFYIIPFDKRGVCVGPKTQEDLLERAQTGDFTDVFLFSHGWNNDWTVATARYESFLEGYSRMRGEHDLPVRDGYKPLLVGVFWPSTALTFGEDESGPAFAGLPEQMDAAVAEELDELAALTEDLGADQARRIYELAQKDVLNREEALDLAEILKGAYAEPDDELGDDDKPSAEELLAVWASAQAGQADLDDFGSVDSAAGATDPQAAFIGGLAKKLDPRPILRTFTVYKMKDRAGTVGTHGVGPLLRALLERSNAKVHLIGHSYGGKVVLSAVAQAASRHKVESMLLLQPAVSHLCFAERVPGTNRPGGYRPVLDRVRQPILSTFSANDFPLTKTFHLALRRKADLGEARIAADGEPPSRYAALGGYGPRHSNERIVPMQPVGTRYELDSSTRVYGLEGDDFIDGHGDVSNDATWWALYNLVTRE